MKCKGINNLRFLVPKALRGKEGFLEKQCRYKLVPIVPLYTVALVTRGCRFNRV